MRNIGIAYKCNAYTVKLALCLEFGEKSSAK